MLSRIKTFYVQNPTLQRLAQALHVEPYLIKLYSSYQHQGLEPDELRIDDVQAHLYFAGEGSSIRKDALSERCIIQELLSNIQPNDVFYSVGARFGLYGCLVNERLNGGEVIAFEPRLKALLKLQRNFELNGVPGQGYQVALTDHKSSTSGWLDLQGQKVPLAIGDELVEEGLPVPNIIKIDVEGGELKVLRGLKETLCKQAVREVYCEIHPEGIHGGDVPSHVGLSGAEIRELKQLLTDRGFSIETLDRRGQQEFIRAWR